MRRHVVPVLMACIVALPALAVAARAQEPTDGGKESKPAVTITVVPPWDPGGPARMAKIAGSASGVAQNCRIVLYAHGDLWYIQPYAASPYTEIDSAGKWSAYTHLGTEYAALLVCGTCTLPDQAAELPRKGGPILAIARITGK